MALRHAAWMALLAFPLAAAAEIDGNLPLADQVELYRARNIVIERELRNAKAELALVKKQLAALRATTQPAVDPAAAAAPAPTADGPLVYHSAVDMFRDLPKELRRPPGGWSDAAARTKAMDWLMKNAVGKPFQAELRLAGAKAAPNPARAKDPKAPKWVSVMQFRSDTMTFSGIHLTQVVQGPGEEGLGEAGDQEVIKAVNDIKRGMTADVSGTIDELTFGHMDDDRGQVVIHLRDYKVMVNYPPPVVETPR
ncbi:MAG: hypothetical protein NTW19_13985 [Planctomycetota bacterium]|nr:hypothetical protein [Planctomycetota bacterium]